MSKHALVVDHSRAVRMSIGRTLSKLGFSVAEAADGVQAIARLQLDGPADVALVDWNMPRLDGLGFLHRVRDDANHDCMRLNVATTETEVGQMVTALEAGADEYLMKPFTPAALRDKLTLLGLVSSAAVRPVRVPAVDESAVTLHLLTAR